MAGAISPKVSVLIPAYNEALTIGEVVSNTIGTLNTLGQPYEVLVIDDGSTDLTGEVAKEEGASVIRFSENMGKGLALRRGFNSAKGDIIVFMNADGINNPEEISLLLAPLINKEVDIVSGSRFLNSSKKDNSIINRFGNLLLGTMLRLLFGKRVTDISAEYLAIRRKALEQLDLMPNDSYIEMQIILRSLRKGFTYKEIPIRIQPLRFLLHK